MNKWQIICPVVAMALFAVFAFKGQAQRESRAYVMAQTAMIGQELVRGTNSSRLTEANPALQSKLSSLLTVPSGVADVVLGDEPRPIGDGTACSRLILSNAVGARLGIRLRQESKPETFRVVGCWTITEPDGAADRDQPFRLETNRMSKAAGPGR